ncbi:MAG: hypothetical protein J6G98_05605 [Bacilli bacterium]|nr:hypothetical protein [Bacilli bacterium]
MDNMEAMTSMTDVVEPTEEIIEEIKEEPVVESEEVKVEPQVQFNNESDESTTHTKSASNFESLFDNLYNDVAGANNFISNLIEQKKNVGVNEQYLEEEKAKLEKAKADFEAYQNGQREAIELEKQRIAEYEKAQKTRLENEQKAFNEEVVTTRKDLELTATTNKNEESKLTNERLEFDKYKAAEEQAIKIANEKLEMEKIEFSKAKEIEYSKIDAEKNKNKLDRETFEKESKNTAERLRLANEELESAKKEFEKYKDVEKQKLELESTNLSQSVARFKELVSQFNSGFKDIPGKE